MGLQRELQLVLAVRAWERIQLTQRHHSPHEYGRLGQSLDESGH